MAAAGEIFTISELQELTVEQLRRVCVYLGIEIPITSMSKKSKLIQLIMDFQHPKENEASWNGNPDWEPGRQRSVRVQRLYELNVLGKKL